MIIVGNPRVRAAAFAAVIAVLGVLPASTAGAAAPRVRLPGHVVPLARARAVSDPAPDVLEVTLTLRRDDEAGFQQFLRDVYDPRSPHFHQFLTQAQIADRFGPSPQAYDRVATWFAAQHFTTVAHSANRLTLTLRGARRDAERALDVRIGSYAAADRVFHANDRDPALPGDLAAHVQAVGGLSDLARPRALNQQLPPPEFDCPNNVSAEDCNLYGPVCSLYSASRATGELLQEIGSNAREVEDYSEALSSYSQNLQQYFADCLSGTFPSSPAFARIQAPLAQVPWKSVDGANQTVGIVAFDGFHAQDVANYLSFTGAPASQIANLSVVDVGTGATLGAAESEVLLDVDVVMSFAPAAHVIVYSAPFPGAGASFQNVFNKMLSDGLVTIVSNSWAYCENQTSLADVQSIESILQSAAASGISVFSASGDSGSACLDGAADTVAVPADVPTITAVGGTTLHVGAGGVYKGETWWDGSAHLPPTGQGGFGVSKFFGRPAYQDAQSLAAMRSVPDVAAPADPANGLPICQDDAGGCPTGLLFGGTSIAAPAWAAFTALLNQAHGSNYGFMNAVLYPLYASAGFHNGASMGSDFAHVGLGTPNLDALSLALNGQVAGVADAGVSRVLPTAPPGAQFANGVAADGQTAGVVVVTLRDINGNAVAGKSVTLAANAGNHATIAPVGGASSVNGGTIAFTVTDLTPETLTFTATDTTDGVILAQHPTLPFVTPPAASSGMSAFPTTQASDGSSTSTVTVTLHDVLDRPVPGKQVLLRQSHNSMIVSANPATTDGTGAANFAVADQNAELENYVAVDLSDGNLAVNGSANVTFAGSSAVCAVGPAPLAGPGYRIDVYASGFPVQANSTYGGVNIFGCLGVTGLAFDGSGNLFASEIDGNVYKLPPGGGSAGNANKLATNAGPGLGGLAFGTDGNLYGVRLSTDGTTSGSGAVVKIDQATGAASTVAPGITCPFNLATDPLTGDLFVADFCGFAAADPTLKRIAGPGGATPVVTDYADSEGAPNGSVNAAADGTLYVVSNYSGSGSIDEIAGTDQPAPPAVTPTGVASTYSAAVFGSNPDGGAQAIIVGATQKNGFDHSVAAYDLTATPPGFSGATLVQADIGAVKLFDSAGCLYLGQVNVVYKVSNLDGSCPLARLADNPSAVLVPETSPASAPQGTPLRFDLSFPHSSVPEGTPVLYTVSGADHFNGQVQVGAGGGAVITYAGVRAGTDTIIAYATIGGTPIASNPVQATWAENKHVSQLYLDTSPGSAFLGSTATLSATLFDISLAQPAGIQNATVQFTLAGQSCSAITNALGFASCALTVSGISQCTLSASYAGGPSYLPASASQLFSVSSFDVLFANGFEAAPPAGSCIVY